MFDEHNLRFNGEREAKYLRFIFEQYLRLNAERPLFRVIQALRHKFWIFSEQPLTSMISKQIRRLEM